MLVRLQLLNALGGSKGQSPALFQGNSHFWARVEPFASATRCDGAGPVPSELAPNEGELVRYPARRVPEAVVTKYN